MKRKEGRKEHGGDKQKRTGIHDVEGNMLFAVRETDTDKAQGIGGDTDEGRRREQRWCKRGETPKKRRWGG